MKNNYDSKSKDTFWLMLAMMSGWATTEATPTAGSTVSSTLTGTSSGTSGKKSYAFF